MRPRSSKIPVYYNHCHQYRHSVHEKSEQQVLGDERQDQRRWRQNFRNQEEKHNQRQQDGDSQGHFFTSFGGQVEDQDTEEWDEDCRKDEVDGIEKGLPANGDVERYIRLGYLEDHKIIINTIAPKPQTQKDYS